MVAINNCFSTGIFPDELKCSRIVPVFKSGDSLQSSNYRPISILHDFSKIIEQGIFERIYDFSKKYNLIDKHQFGFQRKSSTLSAAIRLVDEIRQSLDTSSKNICSCLFIDVTKAFDSIPHELLLNKLYRYGFRGKSYDLLKSFLSDREQYVSIKGSKSDVLFNGFGTPQGSTLGPAIFILYINGIFLLKLHGKLVMFADDTTIVYCCNDPNKLAKMMQEDIETLHDWFNSNKLTLNIKKTKCMIFHPQQHLKIFTVDLKLNEIQIEQVKSFKYLGLTLQETLHWDMHITAINKKISRMSGILHRLGNSVNETTLISIYYSHIHSHPTYLSPIWGHSATKTNLDSLQVVQNNAIRAIFRREYYSNGLHTHHI